VSFATIKLCVASQLVFIVVSVYILLSTQSGNFWIHPRKTRVRSGAVLYHITRFSEAHKTAEELVKACVEDFVSRVLN
jgi:hypothetical protein